MAQNPSEHYCLNIESLARSKLGMSMLKMNSSCCRIEMDSIRQEKVQRFEEFVDPRLKPDLVRAIAKRSVDGLSIRLRRPDTRRIFVDIGLGFHVEFTWSEALNYITTREEKLARQTEEYTRLIASIKAQIKMVCQGIRELLQLPGEGSY
ncbi:hypothetical protein ACSBR2_004251 [Camellia fascicularis]